MTQLQMKVAPWVANYLYKKQIDPVSVDSQEHIVKVKKLHPEAIIPSYAHQGDSGFDLHALEETVLRPNETKLVRTGLVFEIPEGMEIQIRPKSGVSLKTPILIKNTPGTIDSSYRGEVKIIVHNMSDGLLTIMKNNKIAQGVLCEVPRARFVVDREPLSETTRGDGGFGSTGI